MQIVSENNPGTLVISDGRVPHGAYQAIYHKLTKKVEKTEKKFKGNYNIGANDIVSLNQKIEQLLVQYKVQGVRCEITHVAKKSASNSFSSIEKFTRHNFQTRDITSSINYQFDFLVIIPTEISTLDDIAQRYKIDINATRNEIDDDDYSAPFFLRGFRGESTIRMSLEYSDYAVAQALESVISGWVESLPNKKIPSQVKVFLKIEKFSTFYLDKFAKILPLASGAYLIYEKNFPINKALSLVLFCIFMSFLGEIITDKLVSIFYEFLYKIIPRMDLVFTLGDQDYIENKKNKCSRYISVMSLVFLGIFLSIFVNIFSSFIYDKI